MRRYFVPFVLAAVACHSDSPVAPIDGGGGGGGITDAKNMSVGEVRVLTPAKVPNGIELSASAAPSDYLLVVANTSTALDVPANYVVRGNQLAADVTRQNVLAPSAPAAGEDASSDPQAAVDAHMREWVRSHLTPSMAASAARTTVLSSRDRAALGISAAQLVEGQQVTIKVPDEKSSDLCKNYFTTTGTVKKVSTKAIIIADNQQPTTTFTDADFTAIAAEFDNVVYPTDVDYFGTPTDKDANGHIIMYFTPEVNKLTDPGLQSFVGGFFFGGDLFPPTGTGACAQSNFGEIFYLLAPDPNGVINTNRRSTATVRQGTRGTIAHEFQHMINAGVRLTSNAPAFESTWLDEGLSHTAEDAVGRVVKGFGDFQTLTDQLLFPAGTASGSTIANDYNAYFGQNFSRFKFWLARPDTSSPLSKHADENLSSRGAIWALLRWTGDQYSGGNFRAYTKKLVAGPDTGVKNLTNVAQQPLDTLLAGWLVTNYSDHTGIPGLAAKYNYVGYNMRDAVGGFVGGSPQAYPLAVTTLLAGSSVSTKTLPGSGTYYKITVPAGAGRTILVQDPAGSTASFAGAHYYVLRID